MHTVHNNMLTICIQFITFVCMYAVYTNVFQCMQWFVVCALRLFYVDNRVLRRSYCSFGQQRGGGGGGGV